MIINFSSKIYNDLKYCEIKYRGFFSDEKTWNSCTFQSGLLHEHILVYFRQ